MSTAGTDIVLQMIRKFVVEAHTTGQNLVVTMTPDDGRHVKLLCQSCGAVLARNVHGVGVVEHRCTNHACQRHDAGKQARHFFVAVQKDATP